MSHRPYDPFSPLGNWSDLVDDTPPDQGPDNEEMVIEPVDLSGPVEPLTGDAALRTDPEPDPTPAPEPEAPVKPTRARRPRRARKNAPEELDEALARLDKAKK